LLFNAGVVIQDEGLLGVNKDSESKCSESQTGISCFGENAGCKVLVLYGSLDNRPLYNEVFDAVIEGASAKITGEVFCKRS